MLDSAKKGNTTELNSMAYLQELGACISIPFGNLRYDFIFDYNDTLYKVQVKSAKKIMEGEAVYIQLTSGNSKRVKRYQENEIDYFCTYFEGKCYLIPRKGTDTKFFTLRLVAPKNKQQLNVHLAQDYTAEKILSKL